MRVFLDANILSLKFSYKSCAYLLLKDDTWIFTSCAIITNLVLKLIKKKYNIILELQIKL